MAVTTVNLNSVSLTTTVNLDSVSLTTVCLVVVSRLLRVNVPFVINGVTVPVGPSAVNRHGTFLHLF